jgi:nucleotide-binding universal stress UspA family protein
MKPDPESETEKIHVMPLGDQWEVEAQSGAPLAHEDSRSEAIDTAKALARDHGVETVVVHEGDGVTQQVTVDPQ